MHPGQDNAVRFHAVSRSEIPGHRGLAVSVLHDEGADWFLDEDKVDGRILDHLGTHGSEASGLLVPRSGPHPGRWGQLIIGREDISVDEMKGWNMTDIGLYFPVPRGLITEHLAAEISAIGTDQLRHFEPKRI
ncbi:hypothetical protein AB0395_32765 [Streptosporangium sp. NPDC051023]|uniref:hypothetical protein n=1 Tax=Streptosporangium sp. NPDC051023 TaxID=3155410 RepID=UPI00344BE057